VSRSHDSWNDSWNDSPEIFEGGQSGGLELEEPTGLTDAAVLAGARESLEAARRESRDAVRDPRSFRAERILRIVLGTAAVVGVVVTIFFAQTALDSVDEAPVDSPLAISSPDLPVTDFSVPPAEQNPRDLEDLSIAGLGEVSRGLCDDLSRIAYDTRLISPGRRELQIQIQRKLSDAYDLVVKIENRLARLDR